jgi:phosphoglycolate phosphatase-like HAD superfamily hydrolase
MLALDFDGVICNSINECLLTSFNAYFDRKESNITDIPQDLQEYFSMNRFYVRPAREYLLLFKGFEAKIDNMTHSSFEGLKNLHAREMVPFGEKFFRERERSQIKDPKHWLSLHDIYDHVYEYLRNYDSSIFIVTTKDRDSVKKILDSYDLLGVVKDIYSKEISENKNELFKSLVSDYQELIRRSSINFVDDNEWHLADVNSSSINLYFANWGYAQRQYSHSFCEISSLGDIL